MGRNKIHRQRLRYQVSSVRRKTLMNQLTVLFQNELGMSKAESELLGDRIHRYLQVQTESELRSPDQIQVVAAAGREAFRRRAAGPTCRITLTPIHPHDLDVQEESGLASAQTGRLLRLVEEAYRQDALLTTRQLCCLLNLTPTALRNRLQALRARGLWLPVAGLGKKEREAGGVFRSSYVLMSDCEGRSGLDVRSDVGMSMRALRETRWRFAGVLHRYQDLGMAPDDPEEAEWIALWRTKRLSPNVGVIVSNEEPATPRTWSDLSDELAQDFGFSPVRLRAVRDVLEEYLETIRYPRPDGSVIFWAISSDEPAGKPLDACRLMPISLGLFEEADLDGSPDNPELNRMSDLKRQKILRLTTEAKRQGAYLTYADLSYLLGIHSEAIRGHIERDPPLAAPLRGRERDIGRGVSHKEKIIELYLQMHTETEIVTRTGHSYESIENYLREFAAVFVLWERGMPAPLIRKITNRSLKLVNTYLQLVKRYYTPEYALRFQQLRLFHERHGGKKNGARGAAT